MRTYFAGGCFWCITPTFKEMPGVIEVRSGYSGGNEINPKYEDVKAQKTGHRETIEIEYDKSKVSFKELLEVFLNSVDVYDDGGQYIDRGHSYTLAVYYNDEEEKEITLNRLKEFDQPVYVAVEKFTEFYLAEEYHQDYYLKNPEAFENELIESGRKKEHFIYKLAKCYPQLVLPIKEGEKLTQEYKDICLNLKETDLKPEFSFDSRDNYETINTPAGAVEVITMFKRDDFIHMVRALGNRCEPVDVPDSTGAMAIFGLNNIEKYKNDEENYKDSIILLSTGYYSNVDENMVNELGYSLSFNEWINKSITIRKYHELTHFVMRKRYSQDIKPIRDELIADCLGIYMAFNELRVDLLKLFLGIEKDGYREGGRLQNYEGGEKENIPEVLKLIDDLSERFKAFENKSITEIWENIIELM